MIKERLQILLEIFNQLCKNSGIPMVGIAISLARKWLSITSESEIQRHIGTFETVLPLLYDASLSHDEFLARLSETIDSWKKKQV
jgi:hypothetical protein